MNKRDFLTFLAVAPSVTLPAVASDLARNELSGWRPIETAPRDRPVLVMGCKKSGSLAEFGQRIAIAQYNNDWVGHSGQHFYDFTYATHWMLNGDHGYDQIITASHWMPLPEEPK